MQPRRHRLGDVVDDYCPRERRLSNHVIVAMVDDVIKQTRCTTCDFEHPYKEAKVPARRAKKDSTPALFKQVLEHVTEGGELVPRAVLRPNGAASQPQADAPPAAPDDPADRREPAAEDTPAAAAAPAPESDDRRDLDDDGPVHRTLIRATLPRLEGEAREPRPIPTFTVREAATRPKFRRFGRPNGARGARPFGPGGGPSPFTQHGRGQGQKAHGHPQRAGGHHGRPNGHRRGNKGR
ncbi:MAG TPA: hypothetical protein VIL35_07995 [Vicinamibacterales bacterium]